MNKLSPSVMCIDPLRLESQLQALDRAGADQYHIDIMDGHFVPNFCLNQSIIQAVRRVSPAKIDVHLMIENPEQYFTVFAEAGADCIIPHLETMLHPIRALKGIHALGKQAGVALNPATDLNRIPYLLDDLDVICVMTVDPGFAGQTMIPATLDKVRQLSGLIRDAGKQIEIMVDGQIMETTARALVEAGASILVLGSSGLFCRPESEFPQTLSQFRWIGEPSAPERGRSYGTV